MNIKGVLKWMLIIFFGFIIVLTTSSFVFQAFKIPSGAMIPTLLVGDHIFVNKFAYKFNDLERGDVIVFRFPVEDSVNKGVYYIKRVIGLPGDEINIKGRDLYVNGEKIKQVFNDKYIYYDGSGMEITTDKYLASLSDKEFEVIYKEGLLNTTKGKLNFPLTIPQGKIFVLGDNRDNSYDSRFWGFVPLDNITGKATYIHWSWDFQNNNIFEKVRWDRIFSQIN